MKEFVVLVCGGREFRERERFFAEMDAIHAQKPITRIIHGAAKGADALAGDWAIERGIMQRRYPADWRKHGKAAGPKRNQQMLDEGKPDLVLAFPGGCDTENMIAKADVARVETHRVYGNLPWKPK